MHRQECLCHRREEGFLTQRRLGSSGGAVDKRRGRDEGGAKRSGLRLVWRGSKATDGLSCKCLQRRSEKSADRRTTRRSVGPAGALQLEVQMLLWCRRAQEGAR